MRLWTSRGSLKSPAPWPAPQVSCHTPQPCRSPSPSQAPSSHCWQQDRRHGRWPSGQLRAAHTTGRQATDVLGRFLPTLQGKGDEDPQLIREHLRLPLMKKSLPTACENTCISLDPTQQSFQGVGARSTRDRGQGCDVTRPIVKSGAAECKPHTIQLHQLSNHVSDAAFCQQ